MTNNNLPVHIAELSYELMYNLASSTKLDMEKAEQKLKLLGYDEETFLLATQLFTKLLDK